MEPSDPTPPPPPPAAGWYPDPSDPSLLRYWDGAAWSDHRAPRHVSPSVFAPPSAVVAPLVHGEMVPAEPKGGGLRGVFSRLLERVATVTQPVEAPTVASVVASMRHEPPREPLAEQVEVVGETYRASDTRNLFEGLGLPITNKGVTAEELTCLLVPEPWNEHDPNAVAVAIGTHHVGYLPAALAAEYAHALLNLGRTNALATGQARIWAKEERGIVRARVTILIPPAEAFS